ncbi:MAG: hypothetical protein D6689_22120 [Deltaproteobacteria bacterium]|nr:MAG: hypothetical protein D6689_22120 [Deltaproteobacteria bacterium]
MRAAARAYYQLDRAERAIALRARLWMQGFLSSALVPRERALVAIDAYDVAPGALSRELFDWERAWFARRLPPPPAAVFVAAAGDGREAVELRARGYRVDALEPARRLADRCRRRLGAGSEVHVSRLETFDAARARGPYDAVLIGWGGLSHVLDRTDREAALRTCAALAPAGPILASFFVRGAHNPGAASRAHRLGNAAGRAVARLRGVDAGEDAGGTWFAGWYGFAHAFSPDELGALAAAIGRRFAWDVAPGDAPDAGPRRGVFLPPRDVE